MKAKRVCEFESVIEHVVFSLSLNTYVGVKAPGKHKTNKFLFDA